MEAVNVAVTGKTKADIKTEETNRMIKLLSIASGKTTAEQEAEAGSIPYSQYIKQKEAEQNKNTAENSGVDGTENVSVNGIYVGMSENERYEVLKNQSVEITETEENNQDMDYEFLENSIKSKAEKHLIEKIKSLGLLKKYNSKDITPQFDFTMKGLRKSLHSQISYGGTFSDFGKAIVNLPKLLDNAVLIETHTDKAVGTVRENSRLKQVYVLVSVLKDGENFIPVQFEVKQYVNDENRLYLAVTLTKIETGVMGNTASENQIRTSLLPISNISLPDLFKNINPIDADFLKYVPNGFLNDEQKQAKAVALEKEQAKYGKDNDDSTDLYADSFSDEKRAKKRERVETLADKLGLKLNWSSEVTEGKYNPKTREVTLNPNLTAGRMYMFIFKHEFVHDLENRKGYKSFKNYLFNISKTFVDYCETELLNKYGIQASGKNAVAILTDKVYDAWTASEELSDNEKATFDKEAAEREIVCNYVADRLLGGLREGGDYEQESYDALIELADTHRNIFQRFVDWVKDIINKIKGEPTFNDMADELQYLNERLAKVYDSRIQNNSENTIKFSLMNSNNYSYNVDKILDMPDAEALENYREGNFISIMKNTPEIILNEVKGAEDLEVIISFHSLYLETRHDGVLEGAYHNLGEKMKLLPELISNPDAIIRMKNGRINILTSLQTNKGNNGTISIELNTVKDINSKYDKYNLVITVFSSNDNYVLNNLIKHGDYIEYKKEDLSQVNPQLHKSLTIFNEKSSENIVSENAENVNKNSSVNESHSVLVPFSDEFKADRRKKHAKALTDKYGGAVQREQLEGYLKEIAEAVEDKDFTTAFNKSREAARYIAQNSSYVLEKAVYKKLSEADGYEAIIN